MQYLVDFFKWDTTHNKTHNTQHATRTKVNVSHSLMGLVEESILPRLNHRNPPQFSSPPGRQFVCCHSWDEQRTLQEAPFPRRFNCQRLGTKKWQRKGLQGFVKIEATFPTHNKGREQWVAVKNKGISLSLKCWPWSSEGFHSQVRGFLNLSMTARKATLPSLWIKDIWSLCGTIVVSGRLFLNLMIS